MSTHKFTYEELENAFTENLYLIERLQAEVERLEAECERQYEQAEADIRANIADGGTSCHWCMNQHIAEAIKEFVERLKNLILSQLGTSTLEKKEAYYFCLNELDKLVKEMVGDMK